eukprot:7109217-Pyramimonas_sp.AAC.2
MSVSSPTTPRVVDTDTVPGRVDRSDLAKPSHHSRTRFSRQFYDVPAMFASSSLVLLYSTSPPLPLPLDETSSQAY